MSFVFREVRVISWVDDWGVECALVGPHRIAFKIGSKAEPERFAEALGKSKYPDSLARAFTTERAKS